MIQDPTRPFVLAALALASALLAGCATTADGGEEEGEPVYVAEPLPASNPPSGESLAATVAPADEEVGASVTSVPTPSAPPPGAFAPTPPTDSARDASPELTAEIPAAETQAETQQESPDEPGAESAEEAPEVVVQARPRGRDEVIRDLVAEARALLADVELKYFFTGKGRRETLRGRPVAFALWSEAKKEWTIAHVEIPRPPVKWKPGGRPLRFTLRTPGISARHVKGTGAERLMFAFTSRDGETLKVYGRKFPVFDSKLVDARRKNWRAIARTAQAIVYLPFTEDTLDPLFVEGGRQFLLSTARKAMQELRDANALSTAFPGESLADIVPAEVITTLAVIEQTDDADYTARKLDAFNDVLSQYGLKREEAYRYSVSRAKAVGPMQFTDRRGNGTYSLVVRRCRAARLDPNFERGATNLLNVMKAAICLFDIELSQMSAEIREAYRLNKKVLGIFPVAAYNGGPRNVTKLYRVIQRMQLNLADLRPPGVQPLDAPVTCPCLWTADSAAGTRPVSIPRYNNENRWYIQKYQSILGMFDEGRALQSSN
jgi:hypothetical protein